MTSTLVSPALAAVTASLAKEEGEARWFFGDLAVIKLTGAMTGGRLAAVEFTGVQGAAPPLHTHTRDDEVFVVHEGEIDFVVDGKTIAAKAGHVVLAPKDLPHTYVVRSPTARWLVVTFPAGFEDFVRDASAPAKELRLPRPDEPQGDMDAFVAIGAREGIQFHMG